MRGERELDSYFRHVNIHNKNSPKNYKPIEFPASQDERRFRQEPPRPHLNPQLEESKKVVTKGYRKDTSELGRDNPNNLNTQETQSKYFSNKRLPGGYTDEQVRSSKGIGLTSKYYRPASNDKDKQEADLKNPSLMASHSQGHLLKRESDKPSIRLATTPNDPKKAPVGLGKKGQLTEYQKLHEKLNTLENKIAAMKVNLEKKKAEKESAADRGIKERKTREQEKPEEKQIQPSRWFGKSSKQLKEKEVAVGESVLKGVVTQVPRQDKGLHAPDHNPYSPRHNMYYVSEIAKAYREEKSLAREHLLTSMQLLKIMEGIKRNNFTQHSVKPLNLLKKQIYKDKKTIVFDLDQTFIHCNDNTSVPYDVILPIRFPTGQTIEAGINIRPHVFDILKALSINFEIIVFTASHSCYANVVLDYLDPQRKYIQHRLFREHCFLTPQGMYIKDLRVINRKETEMVLIDNAAYSYAFQLDNGIPIIPFYEGKNDFELKALQVYLQRLVWVPDVREVNRKVFQLCQYRNYEDPQKLVKELYSEWMR